MTIAAGAAAHLPRIGFQVWGQFTTWPELAATARDIERLGFDSLWANDHLFPAAGSGAQSEQGITGGFLEGWMTAAGFAMVTERIPVGVLVSGAGYRNPGLLVKQATALDHLSGGRALLGLGAGWHPRDHAAFGFQLPPVPERLDRLEAQSAAVRALLDGQSVSTSGRWVTMDHAVNDPAPVGRLPLMIGGSGEQRTLRIVARDADAWNGEGTPETWSRRAAVLDAHCAAIGRDPGSIRRTAGVPMLHVRDTHRDAVASLTAILVRNAIPAPEARAMADADPLTGTITEVVGALEAWAATGVDELILDWPAPYDLESLERLAEARR